MLLVCLIPVGVTRRLQPPRRLILSWFAQGAVPGVGLEGCSVTLSSWAGCGGGPALTEFPGVELLCPVLSALGAEEEPKPLLLRTSTGRSGGVRSGAVTP